MSANTERYDAASKQFESAYNQYAGQAGLNAATLYGQQQAQAQSGRLGAEASGQAISAARTAGLNPAQAALLGKQAAKDATSNAYQNIYDSSRNAAMNQYNAAVGARQGVMGSAQQQEQNVWNRWATGIGAGLGFAGSMMMSDERLKDSEKIASDENLKKTTMTQRMPQRIGAGLANAGSILSGKDPVYSPNKEDDSEDDSTDVNRDWTKTTGNALAETGKMLASDENLKEPIDGTSILKATFKTNDSELLKRAIKKLKENGFGDIKENK